MGISFGLGWRPSLVVTYIGLWALKDPVSFDGLFCVLSVLLSAITY